MRRTSGVEERPRSFRLLLAALVLVVAGAGALMALRPSPQTDLPSYWAAPDFALLDQDRQTLRTEDLRGKIWLASFVFTNCTDVCPLITTRMASVRDSLREEDLLGREVRLVSFSVDPERDTPEVLREYAGKFGGSSAEEWAFLTFPSPDEMERIVQKGFRLTALAHRPEHGGADPHEHYQVMHAPRVMLVDREGVVRGFYDTTDPDEISQFEADLRILLR